MNYEIDKYIREYFEARPQLDPPAYSSVVGYAVSAPCLHMIESLLNERHSLRRENRKQTTENTLLRESVDDFISQIDNCKSTHTVCGQLTSLAKAIQENLAAASG